MRTPGAPCQLPPAAALRWPSWVVIIGCILSLSWMLESPAHGQLRNPNATPRTVTPRGGLNAEERATIGLFRQASPSVVYITTLARQRDLFSLNIAEIPQGSGSGFIWNQEGHIITNFHVIQGASAAKVTLADHSVWDAQLVGVAPDHDLAVLYINAPKNQLRPLAIGTSADLEVGQSVFAIGNPFGLDQTLTTGIISALGREINATTGRTIAGVIQTDAAINPGNSGGPLLDSAGSLIGVNTAIFSPSGSNAGIGFAVPVDTVNRIVPQLIRQGEITRPGLGVRIGDDRVSRRFKLPGVLIIEVDRGSAAEAAGLRGTHVDARGGTKLGDIIVAIDGDRIETSNDLFNAMEKRAVGATVKVAVIRGEARLSVSVTLQAVR
ncbi:MAG TPA: trypsin-like peptidase domain-containing protein [Candidatus Tectomicrobia bacterium]